MHERELALAYHKTEVLMISNRKAVQRVQITVGKPSIGSRRKVKHLGVGINDRLFFKAYHSIDQNPVQQIGVR